MKVSCPSCEAKYNIADEKIKGKKVKVRCKSCGTQILVDGNSSQVSSVAPPDDVSDGGETQSSSSAALDDSATADAWTVNFSDTDERALTTAEIALMAVQGQLPDEVFVWKEGMADWQSVMNVPELASAIAAAKRTSGGGATSPSQNAGAGSKPPPAGTSGASLGPIVAAPGSALAKKMASAKTAAAQKKAEAEGAKPDSSAQATGHKSPTGAGTEAKKASTEPPPAHKSAPEQSSVPKAATKLAAKRQTGTHDLFAAVDRAGSEIDVDTSDTEHEPVKATGARNENSVLFSLDALKSGMLGGPAATTSSQQSPAGPRKKAPGAPSKRLEDLMTVDGAGSTFGRGALGGGLSLSGNDALLAAPPPPPPKPEPKPEPVPSASVELAAATPRKSRLGLVIVLAVGLVALGAGGAFLALKSTDKETKPEASVATTPSAVATASAPKQASASAAPSVSAAPGALAQNEADAGAPSAGTSAQTQPVAVTKPGAGRPITGKPGAAEPKPTEKKPETKTAEPAPGGAGGFNKEAAVAALSVAASQATVCKRPEGPWGSGRAVVTFASSGRVTTANVTGEPFGGTAVGGCVASVFRRAKIPAFSGDPVTVSKSFTIAP